MPSRVLSILVPWLLLRVVLSVVVLVASDNRPNTDIEKHLAGWPPSLPLAEWAGRAIFAPWQRWDVEHYLVIAERGYQRGDGTAQFHPLYPWLGRAVGFLLGGNMLGGLLVVSSVCGLLFLLAFRRLAEFDLKREDAHRATVLLLHVPVAFILFAPYTEALFLLCSVVLFLMARGGRWWLAGAAGGLAALTRQQGIFLVVPLAWELWEASGRDFGKVVRTWRKTLSLILIPTGLIVWLLYRSVMLGDLTFDLYKPQTWIYGLLISKDATKVVEHQGIAPPWQVLAAALTNPQSTTIIDLVLGAGFVAMLAFGGHFLWRLRPSYFLYASVILLVSFSYFTGSFQPYMGLPRHCLLAFPLFLPLAVWARHPRIEFLLLMLGFLGMSLMTYFYVARILWVP